jgi:hypothetical protein
MFPDLKNNLKSSDSSLCKCFISYSTLKYSVAPRIPITTSTAILSFAKKRRIYNIRDFSGEASAEPYLCLEEGCGFAMKSVTALEYHLDESHDILMEPAQKTLLKGFICRAPDCRYKTAAYVQLRRHEQPTGLDISLLKMWINDVFVPCWVVALEDSEMWINNDIYLASLYSCFLDALPRLSKKC